MSAEFEKVKIWSVDYEHTNEYTKVTFSGIYAKSAEKAQFHAGRLLQHADQWRCIGIDKTGDV